ncbi:hypothetical protein ASF61_08990 [Duganella sp. Leaf126]|nr:hypothetical protein ASF61_08990 [Duganella sp. Leaf126]
MLMTALMPTLSRALAPVRSVGPMWLEICSAVGTRYLEVNAPDSHNPDHTDKRAGVMNDCPYCRVHADLPALPPSPLLLPQSVILPERPALFYQAPTPLYAWVIANPRGPPAV